MSNATVLPTYSQAKFFKWNAKLTAPLAASTSAQTVYWDEAPLDENGAIVTGSFMITCKNTRSNPNESESMWIPANAVAADGLSATGVIRGLKLSGLDYTAADSDNVVEFKTGDEIFCSITPQVGELLRSAIQGLIATGGSSFIIGTDASGTVTVKRSTGAGTSVGFFQWNTASGKAEYSDNGSTWNSFDAVTASTLLTISAADTTPAHGESKIVDDNDTIIITKLNAGGNEQLQVATNYTASKTEIDQALDGISGNVTAANLNTLNGGGSSNADALHTHSGFSRNATNYTAGEQLLAGDTVDCTATDTVKRHAPTLPTATVANTTDGTNVGTVSTNRQVVGVVKLSDSLFATSTLGTLTATSGVHRLHRLPVTASTGVTGTPTVGSATVGTGTTGTRTDMVKAGTDKVLTVASKASGIYALVADLSSSITLGTEVTVDTSNCNFASVDYISDSHCLVIYNDTSVNSIVYAKYTLSGTTLTSSTNATVAIPSGTFTFEGARRFEGTDYFLLVIQNSTAGSAQCAIATYDETLSSFTSVGSWVNFPSDADITASGGVAFVQISDTKMFLSFPSSSTTIGTMLVTRSGTVPSFSSVISTTITAQSGFALAPVNARCVLQTSLDSTTVTIKLIEIAASGDITTRASDTSFTSLANGFACAFHVNSMTMGFLKIVDGTFDTSWGYGLYSFYPYVGVASANVANGASATIVSQGYCDSVSGLTAATKYYAEVGGLLTTNSATSPEKVGVTKDSSEIIIKSW